MFLLSCVISITTSITSRRRSLILIATVLSMTLVVNYIHTFPPSYRPSPSVGRPIVTSLLSVNVKEVIAVGATLVIGTVQKTTRETSLEFTTDVG